MGRAQVDGLVVGAIVVGAAVPGEVLLRAEHDDTTDQENEGDEVADELLDSTVVIVTTGERVGALAVDKVDEGPAVDGKEEEHHELLQGQPGRVNHDAVVPVLEHGRACVDVGDKVCELQDEWRHDKGEAGADEAVDQVVAVGGVVTAEVLAARSVSGRHYSELLIRRFHSFPI